MKEGHSKRVEIKNYAKEMTIIHVKFGNTWDVW
jgi:hypothetical protein